MPADASHFGDLPDIPGGWMLSQERVGDRWFPITRPAVPDTFLDAAAARSSAETTDDDIAYWPYLWPAARTMAGLVLQAPWPAESAILEIGAGIGLVGLAGLSRGWRVTFSDYQPAAVELALYNARQNGFFHAQGLVLDWRAPPDERFDVVLGCDVLYEDRHHAPILNLLRWMLAPDGECWIGDPGRLRAQRFALRAASAGFDVKICDAAGRPRETVEIAQFALLVLRTCSSRSGNSNYPGCPDSR